MIFRILVRIPLVGELLRILNAYAYRGDAKADENFAPIYLWITAFWLQITLATMGALLCTPELTNEYLPIEYKLTYCVQLEPGAMATSILPNLLGFGIGIYALIFGLHKMLLRDLQASYLRDADNKKQQFGSALILNAEMAVPLLVLTITISIGLIQQVAPSLVILKFVSWLSLWLSLVFTLELVVTLFGLGENAILKTLDEVDKS
jgi:hypothetical protein